MLWVDASQSLLIQLEARYFDTAVIRW